MIAALKLSKQLKEQVLPCYLLLGSDLYLQRAALDAFAALADPGWRQFNLQTFSQPEKKGQTKRESEQEGPAPPMLSMGQGAPRGREQTALQRALEAAQTLPMMSPRRIVIMENLSGLKDDQWDELYAYLANPNPRTVFVMVAAKLHAGRVNKISKSAAVVSANEPEPAEARSIIERSFQKDGYRLGEGVVDELVDQAGTNMQALSQQVEKLKLFRLQEKVISIEDVTMLSNRTRSHEIWDLVNLIATRDRRQLLVLLQRLFEDGAVPLVLLKSIYSHFAGLLAVKELAGKPDSAIARITGMNPYYVGKLSDQARRFRLSDLKAALRELHRTDSALKGSGLSDRLLLETLLIRIVGT
ncbi:MAG TPA: DNA polymerase III subunit delta [Acidobacteriota bacterium]|jgi:DNA polymerase-3 subunit delta